MASYAKLRIDLVSARAEIDGQTVFNIKDPVTGNYFRLREPEFWLISQLDGLTSYEEIAEITDLALGTVKTHIHRARKAMAKQLEARGWRPGS